MPEGFGSVTPTNSPGPTPPGPTSPGSRCPGSGGWQPCLARYSIHFCPGPQRPWTMRPQVRSVESVVGPEFSPATPAGGPGALC